jgi:hypothetical protein
MYKEGGNYSEALKFAEAISPTGDTTVRKSYKSGSRLPSNTGSIGRRSSAVSSRSSEGRSSRS